MLKKDPKKNRKRERENGFEEWGGYMNAKITKLEAQFNEDQVSVAKEGRLSNIFSGVAIFVNGYTDPSAEELRCLMLQHGGVYHHYYRSKKTTHVIASSLPNAKLDMMKTMKVVKCEWITESIKAGRLLDYKNYLLQNDLPINAKARQENILMKLYKLEEEKKDIEPQTAADDGYIDSYYKNSRLHYISTLASTLKQFVQEVRENHNGIFPGRKRLQEHQEINTTPLDMDSFGENIIMHIDMDCFFVAVALRNHPHLKGQPVAVTHSKGKRTSDDRDINVKFEIKFYKKKMKEKMGSNDASSESDDDSEDEPENRASSKSEIASCSYEARKAGVTKGMYLGAALKLCPNLKTVPYDFEGYKEVSLTLYRTITEYTLDVEAISCDEMFINCTDLITELKVDPMKFAEFLRREIEEKTRCTSSVGIGANKLQARLATKHAKPNGQFCLTQDKVPDFMRNLHVRELPGVGYTISARLKTLSIRTCEQLQQLPLATLKKEFGEKTGEALYKHSRGEDDRKVNFSNERKSVSAEVNYGIRFNDDEETETFLKQLSEEVSKRLKDIKMMGKNITFKIMFRAKGAPLETAKFLGHGACDQINRSIALPLATDDAQIIARHVIAMYHQFGIPANELRGIGIHMSKLEGAKKNCKTLQDFLNNGNKKSAPSTSVQRRKIVSVRPPRASQIDPEVLHSLPEDIRNEVLQEYGLLDLIPKESEEKAEDKQEEISEDDPANELFSLSLSDMRTMIKEWVATEIEPRAFDVSMLKSYLSRTVEKKKLETVTVLLQCLKRHIWSKRDGDDVWKATYEEIVCVVQCSMRKTFGKALANELVFGEC